MVSDDFEKEMWIAPEIWVPPVVADYLLSRILWIKEGEQGDFQVAVPNGYDNDEDARIGSRIFMKQEALCELWGPSEKRWLACRACCQ